MNIKTKRAYDVAATKDGQRILVDRIWPRGVSKDEARLHEWLKSIGPSNELRKWVDHDKDKDDPMKVNEKKEVMFHEWLKSNSTSNKLRKWFDHDKAKYDTFKEKYKQELKSGEQKKALDKLKEIAHNNNTVTLIFGAKEETYNQATVLKEVL